MEDDWLQLVFDKKEKTIFVTSHSEEARDNLEMILQALRGVIMNISKEELIAPFEVWKDVDKKIHELKMDNEMFVGTLPPEVS